MISYLKYVPHDQLLYHLANGWTVRDELHFTNHGSFAVLCLWVGDGDPS